MKALRPLVLPVAFFAGWLCPAAEPTLLEQAYALDSAQGAARSAKAAAAVYQQAAAQGDGHAQLRLGYLYETGDGVPQSYEQARRSYDVAVAAGLVEARLRLAICHLEGWGGPADKTAFAREVRAAAEAGYQPAQFILARLYLLGFAVPKDREQSVLWFERAAAKGDAEAQLAVGISVAGRAREKQLSADMDLARTWFQRSAAQEHTDGMLLMAKTFLRGKQAERDWTLGRRWLELATESGDDMAPYILALYTLLHVDAPARDEAQAEAWLKLSSARGRLEATEVLEQHKAGKSLAEAAHYVYATPFTERYVGRVATNRTEGDTRPPQVYYIVDPKYPESLLMVGTTGNALVEFVVDASGNVVNPRAIQAPHPLMGESAVAAVKQWRFHAALKEGKPVSARMQAPVHFRLEHSVVGTADEFLRAMQRRALEMGGPVAADSVNLSLGKRASSIPLPKGHKLPDDMRATFVLVLDATGKAVRGHVIDCEPVDAGPRVLAAVLDTRFEPRLVDGKPEAANVAYSITRGRFRNPTLRDPSKSAPAVEKTAAGMPKKE